MSLGLDKGKIKSSEPLAGCQAYTNYLTRLAVYDSDAENSALLLIRIFQSGERTVAK